MRIREMTTRLMAATAVMSLAITLPPAPACAQDQTYRLNIPAMDLGDALRAFGRATRQQVVFSGGVVRGRRSNSIDGSYAPRDALDRLIAGSGLQVRVGSGGIFMVTPGEPEAADAAADESGAQRGEGTPEILVVGSRPTLNADIRRSEDAAQPYVVIDRETIARSGRNSIEDVLRRELPMTAGASTTQQSEGIGSSSVIDLRGLGAEQTLILVDGRRIASRSQLGNARQPDINGIPLSAIERIEVLPTTSSGIYGGNATGGVINIILRRDYVGIETTLRYENSVEGDIPYRRLDLNGGLTFNEGRTSILAYASLSDSGGLRVQDRDYYDRGIARILANNPGQILSPTSGPLLGATTNIRSANGTNLVLKPVFGGGSVGSPFTFIPLGYAGPASDNGAGLIGNAGRYNLELAVTAQQAGGGLRSLLKEPSVESYGVSLRHQLTPSIQIFLDGFGSRSTSAFLTAPISGGTITLSTADSANPFAQNIVVTVPLLGADQLVESESSSARVTTGATFDLPFEWRGALDYSWSHTSFAAQQAATSLTGGQAGAVRNGAINVFRDVNRFPVDFRPFVAPLTRYGPGETDLDALALRLSGPVGITMPGGPVRLTALLERRWESLGAFSTATSTGRVTQFQRSQASFAAYAELTIPLVSPSNSVPAINLLEIQVAGRGEWYDVETSNTGVTQAATPTLTRARYSSINPTLAIRWRPIPDLMLRGSYGTGFLPPTLSQLTPGPTETISAATFQLFNVRDPLRGNEFLGDVVRSGNNNPDLEPERSESWSAGVIVTPRFLPGFRASADWTRIEKAAIITSAVNIQFQQTLDVTLQYFPGRITRSTDPSTFGSFGVGRIIAVDDSLVNAFSGTIEAVDLALEQLIEMRFGRVRFSASATRAIHNRFQLLITALPQENAGTRNFPHWRAIGSIALERDDFELRWSANYVGSYCLAVNCPVNAGQGSSKVSDQIYHDLFARYNFGRRSGLAALELQAGVRNLFDTRPPIDLGTTGLASIFYSPWGDPRGASYYVALRVGF